MNPRIIFAGTPDFALASLEALAGWCAAGHGELVAVYTRADKPAGRGRRLASSPVKLRAQELGVPVRQPSTLRSDDALEELAGFAPDLMVVAAYGLLLPPEVLSLPRLGCINVHASLLPRWRGAAPIHRAILAGDTQTGITIMQLDEGLDTGDMWLKRSLDIGAGETAGTLHDRLASLGGKALLEALPMVIDGSTNPVPQDASQATYARKLVKSEARIDWQQQAAELELKVRAFAPWPVAETSLEGRQLRIWAGGAVAQAQAGGAPGAVIAVSGDSFDVACGEGVLRVTEVQAPGKRPMSVRDFLNAHSLSGKVLGRATG